MWLYKSTIPSGWEWSRFEIDTTKSFLNVSVSLPPSLQIYHCINLLNSYLPTRVFFRTFLSLYSFANEKTLPCATYSFIISKNRRVLLTKLII